MAGRESPYSAARLEGEVPSGSPVDEAVAAARDLVEAADALLGASFWNAWDRLTASLAKDAFDRAEAQAKWRSEPEIVEALDVWDEYTSMISQGYAHAKETMPPEFLNTLKLGSSVVLRVRSQYRCTSGEGE